ncbi:MAG: ATP-binding protein [Alistipes sp.]|nr:ATP-binding protein [Candidatus Alistipes equi]
MFNAIQKNALLIINEMEASRHLELMEFVIQQFLRANSNSQLLLTTHYDRLLRQIDDLIRKGNVWFKENVKSGTAYQQKKTDHQ